MRRALACIGLAVLAHGQGAATGQGERAFVELIAPRESVYVQERFSLRLRVGYDREFFRTEAVQLFRQPLGVPLQIVAPWLAHPVGAEALPETAALGDGKLTVALDDGIALASPAGERTIEGRAFDVLEIERAFLATGAGELAIPAPSLRYAFATRFDDDFLHGRVAADRRDALVTGRPLTLAVLPLPEEGRPLEFGGAVGRFSVSADVARSEVEVGQSLALVLRIEGTGNLAEFDTPRLAGLDDFHLRGTIDDKSASRRTITYDLAPAGVAVKEIPALAFAYFDPEPPAGYRTLRTQPIAIRVRAPAAAADGERPAEDGAPAGGRGGGPGAALYVSVAVVAALGVAGFLIARRRPAAAPAADPGHARARAAAAEFRSRSAQPDANLADAFASYLAACAGVPAATLKVRDLPALLERAGAPAELARRATVLLEEQLAARYGGGPQPGGVGDLRALVDALDEAFAPAGGERAARS